MMPTMGRILAVVWLHFVADFIMQTDDMAKNKSTSNKWLLYHTSVYTLCLFPIGIKWALLNGVAHTITDWITSRINARLWAQGKVHYFFVGVGLDQAVHITTMLLTLR